MNLVLAVVLSITCVLFGHKPVSAQEDYRATLRFDSPGALLRPTGWGGGPRSTLLLDSVIVHGGRYAGRIERAASSEGEFSTFTFSLPRTFTGQTLELRGWLRTEAVTGWAGLWLREDGPNGSVQFDNMQRRNLRGTTEWTEYRITLPLDDAARTIFLGALLAGEGKVWVDDLELLVDGRPAAEAAAHVVVKSAVELDGEFDAGSRVQTQPLTRIQVENLALLGKVWGFAKYHHPRVRAGEVNWDYELFRVMPSVLQARDRAAAARTVSTWLTGLGKIKECSPCAALPLDTHLTPDIVWIRDVASLGRDLSGGLVSIHRNRPLGAEHYYVSFMPRVGNPVFSSEASYAQQASPDAGFRLLGLFRFWNIIQYWFPYRDVIGEDWDRVLVEFIPRLMAAENQTDYRVAMLELSARIHDTHANLRRHLAVQPPHGDAQLPVIVRFIEDKAVVTGYSHAELGPATGLRVGDVIERIDNAPVDSLLVTWRRYYSASNEPTRLRDIARKLTRGDVGRVRVTGMRADGPFVVTAARVPVAQLDVAKERTHDRPGEAFQLLSDSVAYLKLSSVVSAETSEYIRRASNTKVLIVDIRNYPKEFVVFTLGGHLVALPTKFARFTRADGANPGAFQWSDGMALQPRQPQYTGTVVVLVDETTQSQAEYTAMALRAGPKAIVVGSTTAGADGNVSSIPLPGGIASTISGIGVFYPDGTPTQRVGIVPDVEVRPTIRGIREGRDEVLEAGVRAALSASH